MKTAIRPRPTHTAGFSLLEMLTVIAILGILSSLALAWFGGDGREVKQARDQRNAQNVCSLCQAVEAAGISLVLDAATPVDIVRRLALGITIEKGPLKGRTFRVPGLGQEEVTGAARFISIRNGQIRYDVTERAKNGASSADQEI